MLEEMYAKCETNPIKWAPAQENLSLGVCEQQKRRPVCAYPQSAQRLFYWLFGKYHI